MRLTPPPNPQGPQQRQQTARLWEELRDLVRNEAPTNEEFQERDEECYSQLSGDDISHQPLQEDDQ